MTQPDWLADAMTRHYEMLQQWRELKALRKRVEAAETKIPPAVRRWRGIDIATANPDIATTDPE